MAYKFIQNLTNINYESGNYGRKYIVIHYTGNQTDTAAANANYFKNVNRDASAHYFVDKTEVVQVVQEADTAWAVGVDYGGALFGQCTNYNSISIEMCSDNGAIAQETYLNTIELTKSLMARYGIPASNVVRHWDVCGKQCPGWNGWGTGGKDASIWNAFKAALGGAAAAMPTPQQTASGTISTAPEIIFTYRVFTDDDKWLPPVNNLNDYAGVRGHWIRNIAIKVNIGSVWYQVHVVGEGWLAPVNGYNINDYINGYAGNDKPIDAIRVYYNTPADYAAKYGYQKAQYRVSAVNRDYWSWQYDNDTDNGQDGFAGAFGHTIDRFQLF